MLPCGRSLWLLLCARPPLHKTRIHLPTSVNDAVPCSQDIYCNEPSKHIFTRTTASRYYLLADPFAKKYGDVSTQGRLSSCHSSCTLQHSTHALPHHASSPPVRMVCDNASTCSNNSRSSSSGAYFAAAGAMSLLLNPSSPII